MAIALFCFYPGDVLTHCTASSEPWVWKWLRVEGVGIQSYASMFGRHLQPVKIKDIPKFDKLWIDIEQSVRQQTLTSFALEVTLVSQILYELSCDIFSDSNVTKSTKGGKLGNLLWHIQLEPQKPYNPKDDDADHLAMKICSICSALGGGAYYQAMAKAAINTQPVYHYLVRYDAPHPMIEGSRYSWHTADLPLQFRVVLHDECEPISLILSNMIASFARTGVPECVCLNWPVFTPEKQETMVFDDICHIETNPNAILRRTLGLL